MDQATKRLYYNLCNPDQPLPPDSERNVDVDELGDADQPVRGDNWVNRLAEPIEFAIADAAVEKPACIFFTGLPGSGKSTEILRLRKRLQDRQGTNLLVVYIDAERLLDLTDAIDISDIYVVILYEVERRLLEVQGKDPALAMGAGALARISDTLQGLSFEGAKVQISALGAALALEMKAQPSLRQEVRRRVAAHTTTFLKKTREELVEFRAQAKDLGYSGIVVLFDSLEKLRGISTNFTEVLESAEKLFAGEAPYLRLPVHVLYTIPPALILRLRQHVEFMPMIKLWDRTNHQQRFQPGFDAALSIIRKRIPEDKLSEFLGGDSKEAIAARLDQLVVWSAGYPREIIRLLRSVIQQAPLSDRKFERLLGQAGDEYRRLLLASDLDWLARVAVEHTPLPADEIQRQAADRMFANNVVLRYQNTQEWYDVHPAVRAMPALEETIRRRAAEKKT